MDMPSSPRTLTLDTNLLLDKATNRTGADLFNRLIDLTKLGYFKLYYAGTTDFEDKTGEVMRLVIKLEGEGLIQEDPNVGTGLDFIPGNPGLHRVEDKDIDDLVETIWPNAQLLGHSYESKRGDACHLMAHKLNKRDVF